MGKKDKDVVSNGNDIEVKVSESRHFFCNRAFINYNEEAFLLSFQTGDVVDSQFAFSPKHAKRLMLKLKEKIEEFEKKYGELVINPEE
ncbi:MAG: DUF3467 domain-containing protein [Lutibacter sp.]|jgi:hypothetical protein